MIVITNQPLNPPHNAYNNSIIEFGVDAGSPTLSKITVGGFVFEIFPDVQGKFYFNFKSIATSLINGNMFGDDIVVTDPNVYLYPDPSLFLEINVNIEVELEAAASVITSLTFPFLKSVEQVRRNRYNNSELMLLTPNATDACYLSYFEGLPFDISVYSDVARNVTVLNKRTGMTLILPLTKGVNRVFISNGENDNLGFESQLPLYLGVNELEFKIGTVIHFTLFLDKKPVECGKLLKWFNPSGGWSYFRFQSIYINTIKSKTIDRVNQDFKNLNDAIGNISITGKETEGEISLFTGLLDLHERNLLDTLVSSPKVFMYGNEILQPFEEHDYVEVEIDNGSFSRSTKQNITTMNVKVLTPKIYAQTL